MKKNAKKNNKGFSLVELIIVVAIMAILIGVLGGQYLKFVEKSRQSTDKANVDEIIRAVQIYCADPSVESDKMITGEAKITITTTSTPVSATNATNNANLALTEAGIDKLVLKSSKWSATTIEITFEIDTEGNVSVKSITDPKLME